MISLNGTRIPPAPETCTFREPGRGSRLATVGEGRTSGRLLMTTSLRRHYPHQVLSAGRSAGGSGSPPCASSADSQPSAPDARSGLPRTTLSLTLFTVEDGPRRPPDPPQDLNLPPALFAYVRQSGPERGVQAKISSRRRVRGHP